MASIDTASRLALASNCALKFKYQYVHEMRGKESGAFVLGNAVHNGLEAWFNLDQDQRAADGSLESCVSDAWFAELPSGLEKKFREELKWYRESEKVVSAIKISRPNVANVSATKEYKSANEVKKLKIASEKTEKWLAANEASIRWSKTEPPIKTWQVAERIAGDLQSELGDFPRPHMVEDSFNFEYGGYLWRGRIDVYGPISVDTGEIDPVLIDWKTSQNVPIPMEIFYQSTIYHMALTQHFGLPLEKVHFRILRKRETVSLSIDPEKHYPMLIQRRKDLESVINEQGIYFPSYSYNCKFCDFASNCESYLGLKEEA